jgi:hypothetical protein
MDVLNIFVVASLFAAVLLPRLWAGDGFPGCVGMLLPLVFAGVIFFGLGRISQIVVDQLLAPTRLMNLEAEERIATFWATGDEQAFLEPPTVRPNPELALRLIRDPQLQSILPAACLPVLRSSATAEGGPPASALVTDRLSGVSKWLLRNGAGILTAGLLLFVGLCGYSLARGACGLARANPTGIIVLLAGLAALGFVWSKRTLQRDSVEYEMQRELAAHFKSVNNVKRADFHEHRSEVLQRQMHSEGAGRP